MNTIKLCLCVLSAKKFEIKSRRFGTTVPSSVEDAVTLNGRHFIQRLKNVRSVVLNVNLKIVKLTLLL